MGDMMESGEFFPLPVHQFIKTQQGKCMETGTFKLH